MMSKNPERVAWMVIVGAFIAFLAFCTTVPLGVRYYLEHSTSAQLAQLEVIAGTVRVRDRGAAAPMAVTSSTANSASPMLLSEGSSVETDETSRCIITFFDRSTVTLFPGTQITLLEMHEPTFEWSLDPSVISIDQTRGRLHLGPSSLIPQGSDPAHPRTFAVSSSSPEFTTQLTEGTYTIDVNSDTAQVTVSYGTATVSAQNRDVKVGLGQRTVVTLGAQPLPPMAAAQNILINGDFKDPLSRRWDFKIDPSSYGGNAQVNVAEEQLDDRSAVHIVRSGAKSSANVGLIQQINREVSDYRSLLLQADIRLHFQSLSGGGVLSSEYPLIVRLNYRDVSGQEGVYVHGFYYQNTENNPTNNGEGIQQDTWHSFESGNLLDQLDPRPFTITSLEIYASGWDYDAYISDIQLIVE